MTEVNMTSIDGKVNVLEALAFELFDYISGWILHLCN